MRNFNIGRYYYDIKLSKFTAIGKSNISAYSQYLLTNKIWVTVIVDFSINRFYDSIRLVKL